MYTHRDTCSRREIDAHMHANIIINDNTTSNNDSSIMIIIVLNRIK